MKRAIKPTEGRVSNAQRAMITDEYPIADEDVPHAMLVRAYNDLLTDAEKLEASLQTAVAALELAAAMDPCADNSYERETAESTLSAIKP